MASYAAPSDLIARFRRNTINELANDDGLRESGEDLATNANVLVALADASGQVEAALVPGKRYTTDTLDGLTGNALALLKRIVCDLAVANLYNRNPLHNTDELARFLEIAEGHLKKLQTGENIFNLEDNKTASLPTVDGPTSTEYQTLNTIPERAHRYFPNRKQRLPTNRG